VVVRAGDLSSTVRASAGSEDGVTEADRALELGVTNAWGDAAVVRADLHCHSSASSKPVNRIVGVLTNLSLIHISEPTRPD